MQTWSSLKAYTQLNSFKLSQNNSEAIKKTYSFLQTWHSLVRHLTSISKTLKNMVIIVSSILYQLSGLQWKLLMTSFLISYKKVAKKISFPECKQGRNFMNFYIISQEYNGIFLQIMVAKAIAKARRKGAQQKSKEVNRSQKVNDVI